MSRAQVTPERIAEIRKRANSDFYTSPNAEPDIRDLLVVLDVSEAESQRRLEWLEAIKIWRDRAISAERQLAAVTQERDEAVVDRERMRDRYYRSHTVGILDQIDSIRAERDALKQERDVMRAALIDLLAASGDPNAVTGEFDTAAGRARRVLNAASALGGEEG